MAEFPAVQSVGQLLSEMSNRDANTNQMLANTQLINARVPYEQAATAELLQNMQIKQQNQAQIQAARQKAMGFLLSDGTAQDTALTGIELQTNQQQMQAQTQNQGAANAQRNQIVQRDATGPIGRSNPDTPSYAEQKAKETPVDAQVRALSNTLKQAQTMFGLTTGLPEQAQWKSIIDNTQTNLEKAVQKKTDQDAKKVKEIAGLFPEVKSAQELNDKLAFVHDEYPDAWPKIASLFNADPKNPGNVLYDKKALNAIQGLTNQAASYEDRAKMMDAKARIAETARANAEREAAKKREDDDRNSRAAQAQAAKIDADAKKKDESDEKHGQRALTQLQTISSTYSNNQPVKEFQTIMSTYTAQEKYLYTGRIGPDGKPEQQPQSAQDSAGDAALTDAYLKLVHPNYKGSVYELKELKGLAGVPERVFQAFKNLAVGAELPREIRYDMFRTMTREFREQNELQIEREDSALSKTQNLKKYLPPEVDVSNYIPTYAIRPEGKTQQPNAPKVTSRQPDAVAEGQTATNPQTGQKLVFRNGQWQTVQ